MSFKKFRNKNDLNINHLVQQQKYNISSQLDPRSTIGICNFSKRDDSAFNLAYYNIHN